MKEGDSEGRPPAFENVAFVQENGGWGPSHFEHVWEKGQPDPLAHLPVLRKRQQEPGGKEWP